MTDTTRTIKILSGIPASRCRSSAWSFRGLNKQISWCRQFRRWPGLASRRGGSDVRTYLTGCSRYVLVKHTVVKATAKRYVGDGPCESPMCQKTSTRKRR